MRSRYRAVSSLRINYTSRGVYQWLKVRHTRHGDIRGWQRVLRDPDGVWTEQQALTEGYYL
jgi:hypothetical protein